MCHTHCGLQDPAPVANVTSATFLNLLVAASATPTVTVFQVCVLQFVRASNEISISGDVSKSWLVPKIASLACSVQLHRHTSCAARL
jgi:hypothetical protein